MSTENHTSKPLKSVTGTAEQTLLVKDSSIKGSPNGDAEINSGEIAAAFNQMPIPELNSGERVEQAWSVIRAGSKRTRSAPSNFPIQRRHFFAMAAALVLGICLWQLGPLLYPTGLPKGEQTLATVQPPAEVEALNSMAEMVALMDLSLQLEEEWQQIRQRPRAVSGAEIERQQQLAGLIASVDARLTGTAADDSSRERDLWRQRVVLMNELVAGGVQAKPAVWTL